MCRFNFLTLSQSRAINARKSLTSVGVFRSSSGSAIIIFKLPLRRNERSSGVSSPLTYRFSTPLMMVSQCRRAYSTTLILGIKNKSCHEGKTVGTILLGSVGSYDNELIAPRANTSVGVSLVRAREGSSTTNFTLSFRMLLFAPLNAFTSIRTTFS